MPKDESIKRDFDRIKKKYRFARGVEEKIKEGYSLYALLLADIWIPKVKGERKLTQKDSFQRIGKEGYFSIPINEEKLSNKETYHIVITFEKVE